METFLLVFRDNTCHFLPYTCHYCRTILPEVMQDECSEIEMMVYQYTIVGEEAYNEAHEDGHHMGAVYLPSRCGAQTDSAGK